MEKEEAEENGDKKKIQEYEGRIRELSDAIKQNNIYIIGMPEEEEERERGQRCTWANHSWEFLNLGKETGIEIQEAQRTPFRHNLNQSSAQHIILKLPRYKDKGKILKADRDKQALTYKVDT